MIPVEESSPVDPHILFIMNTQNRPKNKRAIIAGLDLKDIRSLLNNDHSADSATAAQQSHRLSFFLHFRPRHYPQSSTLFRHTYYLGFLLVLLFFVELITGLFLMVYYVPTPEGAYSSILRIVNTVPFGKLLRDIHRLCGELIVIVSVLHLARVFLTQSYEGQRRSTWMTGVVLLIGMLLLAFTGYLLPWDQLAYWAVTIGTSMAEATPLIGKQINLLLRGGADIGADGLLRFYLLHIAVIPMFCFVFLGIHYYRVSRLHGLAIKDKAGNSSEVAVKKRKTGFLPEIFLQEIFLVCLSLFLIISAAHFLYEAPLEHHANPSQTPWNAQAPWYFLWLQGLLKIGDKTITGVIIPTIFLILLCIYPYLAGLAPFRFLRNKAASWMVVGVFLILMGGLSYMGTHYYGIQLPPHIRLANEYMPLDGKGLIHRIPFKQLKAGLYFTDRNNPEVPSSALKGFLERLRQNIEHHKNDTNFYEPAAIVMVEEWQHRLKRVTLRIQWLDKTEDGSRQSKSFQRILHLHEMNNKN